MKKTIFILAATAAFLSCSKSGSDDDNPTPTPGGGSNGTVTTLTLMASTGKRWALDVGTLTYYNAGGGTDSTVTLNGAATPCWIYFTDNNGVGGLHQNYDVQYPLTKALPGFGTWAVNQAAQKINFTCIAPYCNGMDGDWQIVFYYKYHITDGESLKIERTLSLAAGRKVKQRLELEF
jgi:hypothetical protein